MRTRHFISMFLGTLFLSFSLYVSSPHADSSFTIFQAAINSASSVIIVEKSGDGTGTVTSNVAGINCGQDCEGAFPTNTMVTLTATTEDGFDFAGWEGACSGTAPTCTLQASGQLFVTAEFVEKALVEEEGIWWGIHNGGRPTFYFTHLMKHYPPTFIVEMDGCETVEVINNGHRFETNKLIVKQSDVSGRGMALTTQSGQCGASRASRIFYDKEEMPVENPPVLIP